MASNASGPGPALRRPGRYARLRASIGRHPVDLIKMAIAAGIVIACLFIARAPGMNPVEAAIFTQLERMPPASAPVWQVLSWGGSWAAIVVSAGFALYAGRARLGFSLLVTSVTAWVLTVILRWLTPARRVPDLFGAVPRQPAGGVHFPSLHVAIAAALIAVAAPYVSRTAKTVGWAVVVLVAAAVISLGHDLPVGALGGAALGWGAAAFYHVLIGAPGRRTSERGIRLALDALGLHNVAVAPVPRRLLRPEEYAITTEEGDLLDLKVVQRMHRLAGPAYKLRRLLASMEVENEPGLSTPRHEVEHEAYVTLLAERAGIGTLPLVSAGEIRHGSAFLIHRRLEGRLLHQIPADQVADQVLDRLWSDVLSLGRHHVGHHDLRAKHILVDAAGRPRITDFTFSRVGGPQTQREQDIADLLVTTTAVVGVRRAVDSAVRQVPQATLADALPRLQWLAVHRRLRRQLRHERAALAELRELLADRLECPPPTFRSPVRPVTLAVLLAVGLAIYLLLPQLASFGQVVASLRNADWRWIAMAVLTGLLGVLASGVSLLGSTRQRLPFWKTMAVQLAAAFTGRTTVGGVGFYGLNIVYLERLGLRRTHAAGAVFLNRAIMAFVTGAATAIGVLIIGTAVPVGDIRLPPWPVLLGGAVVVVAIGAAVLGSRWGRRRLWQPMMRSLRGVLDELIPTLGNPMRALQLFGGCALFIVLQAIGLAATLAAFLPSFDVLAVLAVYVVGTTLGQLVPTPGGLGAVEAATIAGLSAVGVDPTSAVAAVLASRVLTYWLPAVPGIVAFRVLQHRGVV